MAQPKTRAARHLEPGEVDKPLDARGAVAPRRVRAHAGRGGARRVAADAAVVTLDVLDERGRLEEEADDAKEEEGPRASRRPGRRSSIVRSDGAA